jgi:hypothetical protein
MPEFRFFVNGFQKKFLMNDGAADWRRRVADPRSAAASAGSSRQASAAVSLIGDVRGHRSKKGMTGVSL